MHIGRVCERLQIQFRISRSCRRRNPANLGSKIRFGFAEGTNPKAPYCCDPEILLPWYT